MDAHGRTESRGIVPMSVSNYQTMDSKLRTPSDTPIEVLYLGRTRYSETWELQKKLQRELIDGIGAEKLLLCEHHPVVTTGKSTKAGNLLISEELLRAKNIELFAVERGGDVTYHGPGQIVGYPILNLNHYRRDVAWYMRTLEQVIIELLQQFGVPGERRDGRTGVWTKPSYDGTVSPERKIASIGVRISRWCTMHGFALNVLDCTQGFSNINPCGFTDIEVTSIEQERSRLNKPIDTADLLPEVTRVLGKTFVDVFSLLRSTTDATNH